MRKALFLSALMVATAVAGELPELQVTATRVEIPVDHVGDEVEVITKDEINKLGITSVADVLKYVAGVSVSSNGGFGQTTSVFMLGLPSKHVLVMIDGVPINDPSSVDSQANFPYLDLNNVEKVEILKGPQGALYGSEAIAGVINIITKKPKKNEFKVGFEGGKYKTFKENIYSALKLKNGYFSLSFENFKTNGFSATNKNSPSYESDNDGYSYKTGWLSWGWNLTPTFTLKGNVKLKGATTDFDNAPLKGAQANYNNFFVNLEGDEVLNEKTLLAFKFGNNKEDRDYGSYIFKGVTRYFSLQPTYYLSENSFLTGGFNFKEEISQGYPRLNTKSLFTELHSKVGRLYGTFAVRRDFHSKFGAKTTYKVSALYSLFAGTKVKGEYGTGFKAPSSFQLFSPWGGNPDLKAESSEGWILGLEQELPYKKGKISLNYFKNHLWNLITWVPTGGWSGVYKNAGKGETEGAELKLRLKLFQNLSLFGTYTHLHLKSNDSNFYLRKPKISWTLGTDYYYGKFSVSLWSLHYSSRTDLGNKDLPPFTVYNAYLSYNLSDRCKLYLKGVNLTNKKYELAYGYNTMGRAAFVGIKWRL